MCTVMGIAAEKRKVSMEGMKAHVIKTMSEDLPRRISRLTVHIDMPLLQTDPAGPILEKVAHGCPVKESLHPDIDLDVQFRYRAS